MSLPTHRNPATNRTANAPYNFVPLPEMVIKAVDDTEQLPNHNTYANADYPHTGYFEVTLTTKSPLYVRCPFTIEDFLRQERGDDADLPYSQQVKNTPPFFYTRYHNQPVIPGSSLRGMLRNLLEIMSYGKINKVTNKNLIYRAVGDPTALGSWYREQTLGPNQSSPPHMKFDYTSPRIKGGYLCRHNGQWAIRPAQEHHNESFIHVEYTAAQPIIGGKGRWRVHEVIIQPAPKTASNRGRRGPGNLTLNLAMTSTVAARTGSSSSATAGIVPAVLVESGHMGGAHAKHMHCAIYEEDPHATPIPIPQEMWEAYEEDRDMNRGIQTRKLTATGQPLFYLLDSSGHLVFFGSTMMFRLPYKRSIHQLIPESLRQPLLVDYADALFGFVREKDDFPSGQSIPPQGSKARSYASRVFVTDAILASEIAPSDLWLTGDTQQAITPRILASPKPTSFQLYLVQPETERTDLSHYDSPTRDANGVIRGHGTVIRGHKRYWHQKLGEELSLTNNRERIDKQSQVPVNSTQHTRLNPIKSGVQFKFRVYFENLSERELGAMCWTLHPMGEQTKTYCHHLGMGKPLGMGAVKLEATLLLTNRTTRYGSLFNGDQWQMGMVGGGESLADISMLEQRTRDFEQYILGELRPDRPCTHLSELKRVGMLLKTMEWPGIRPDETRYMTIQPTNEFRDRPVLPDPSAFGTLTGLAESTVTTVPTSSPQAGGAIPAPAHARMQQQRSPNPANIGTAEVESVKKAIRGLGGPGEVSLLGEIVNRIIALPDFADQRECAQLLQKWLQDKKLWNKDKHVSKDWYKNLEEMLGRGT